MHIIEHLLGLCGESHLNIFTTTLLIILFRVFIRIIFYLSPSEEESQYPSNLH